MMIMHGLSQKYDDALRKLSIYDYLYHASHKNKTKNIKYKKAKHLFFLFLTSLKIVFRILGIERFLSIIKNMFSINSQIFDHALH